MLHDCNDQTGSREKQLRNPAVHLSPCLRTCNAPVGTALLPHGMCNVQHGHHDIMHKGFSSIAVLLSVFESWTVLTGSQHLRFAQHILMIKWPRHLEVGEARQENPQIRCVQKCNTSKIPLYHLLLCWRCSIQWHQNDIVTYRAPRIQGSAWSCNDSNVLCLSQRVVASDHFKKYHAASEPYRRLFFVDIQLQTSVEHWGSAPHLTRCQRLNSLMMSNLK